MRRGSPTIWFDTTMNREAAPTGRRGRQQSYSNAAIQTCLRRRFFWHGASQVFLIPNQRWSLDFVADTFGASRKFRILEVIDDCCDENLCLIADTRISGVRVARALDAMNQSSSKGRESSVNRHGKLTP